MGKLLVGVALMGAGIIWYFGWPGAVFTAGGVLAMLGAGDVQERR